MDLNLIKIFSLHLFLRFNATNIHTIHKYAINYMLKFKETAEDSDK